MVKLFVTSIDGIRAIGSVDVPTVTKSGPGCGIQLSKAQKTQPVPAVHKSKRSRVTLRGRQVLTLKSRWDPSLLKACMSHLPISGEPILA